jgi:hypothetical protein
MEPAILAGSFLPTAFTDVHSAELCLPSVVRKWVSGTFYEGAETLFQIEFFVSASECRAPLPWVSGRPGRLPTRAPHRSGRAEFQSSRQTLSIHALLPSDHGGTGTPGHLASAILPAASGTASAPTNSEFRGSITRPASSLSTLRSDGYPSTTQDSLPGGGQPYPGGTRPAGSVRKVSE